MRRRSESAIPARHIKKQILLTNLHAFCGGAHSQPEKGARRKREGLAVGILCPGSGWYTHRVPPTLSMRPLHAQRPSSACAQEEDASEMCTCGAHGHAGGRALSDALLPCWRSAWYVISDHICCHPVCSKVYVVDHSK